MGRSSCSGLLLLFLLLPAAAAEFEASVNGEERLIVVESGTRVEFVAVEVETFQGDGTVSCQITTGDCDTKEVAFEVKPDAALASVDWNLSQNGVLNAQVNLTIYNGNGTVVSEHNDTGQGEYSTEFSGADLESLGEWKWEIETRQGSMDWEVTIRVELPTNASIEWDFGRDLAGPGSRWNDSTNVTQMLHAAGAYGVTCTATYYDGSSEQEQLWVIVSWEEADNEPDAHRPLFVALAGAELFMSGWLLWQTWRLKEAKVYL